jgi:cytochrome c5
MHVYQAFCAACHDGANVEAPPLDDIEAWDERAYGWDSVLRHHAARGFLDMPANHQLSEESINDALLYMETRIRALDEQSRNSQPEKPSGLAPQGPG